MVPNGIAEAAWVRIVQKMKLKLSRLVQGGTGVQGNVLVMHNEQVICNLNLLNTALQRKSQLLQLKCIPS